MKTIALLALALLLVGNMAVAATQHGRIIPRRTYNAHPTIGVTVLIVALIAVAVS